MSRKIPPDAFELYMSLGPGRSYQAVATKYRVSKRAVTTLALRERWQERAAEVEQKAKQTALEKAQETLEAINARHLKALRVIQPAMSPERRGRRMQALSRPGGAPTIQAAR